MTLREYLIETKTRQSDFAATIDVTQATISRLVSGAVSPSIELAAKIKRATQDRVTFEAWVTCDYHPNQETSHDNS